VPRQNKPEEGPLQPHDDKDGKFDGQEDKKPIISDKSDGQGSEKSDGMPSPVSSDNTNSQPDKKLDSSHKVGGQEGTTVGGSEKLDGQAEQNPGAGQHVDGQRDAKDVPSGATEKPDINKVAPKQDEKVDPSAVIDKVNPSAVVDKVDPSAVVDKVDPSAATNGQADKNAHTRNGLRRKTTGAVKASILSAPRRRRYDPSRYEIPFVRGGQLKIKLSNEWHY